MADRPEKCSYKKMEQKNILHWTPRVKKHDCSNLQQQQERHSSASREHQQNTEDDEEPEDVRKQATATRKRSSAVKNAAVSVEEPYDGRNLRPTAKRNVHDLPPDTSLEVDHDDRRNTIDVVTPTSVTDSEVKTGNRRSKSYSPPPQRPSFAGMKKVASESSLSAIPLTKKHNDWMEKRPIECLQFALSITEDIIRNDISNFEKMHNIFKRHIKENRGRLKEEDMLNEIEAICKEVNVPFAIKLLKSPKKESRQYNRPTSDENDDTLSYDFSGLIETHEEESSEIRPVLQSPEPMTPRAVKSEKERFASNAITVHPQQLTLRIDCHDPMCIDGGIDRGINAGIINRFAQHLATPNEPVCSKCEWIRDGTNNVNKTINHDLCDCCGLVCGDIDCFAESQEQFVKIKQEQQQEVVEELEAEEEGTMVKKEEERAVIKEEDMVPVNVEHVVTVRRAETPAASSDNSGSRQRLSLRAVRVRDRHDKEMQYVRLDGPIYILKTDLPLDVEDLLVDDEEIDNEERPASGTTSGKMQGGKHKQGATKVDPKSTEATSLQEQPANKQEKPARVQTPTKPRVKSAAKPLTEAIKTSSEHKKQPLTIDACVDAAPTVCIRANSDEAPSLEPVETNIEPITTQAESKATQSQQTKPKSQPVKSQPQIPQSQPVKPQSQPTKRQSESVATPTTSELDDKSDVKLPISVSPQSKPVKPQSRPTKRQWETLATPTATELDDKSDVKLPMFISSQSQPVKPQSRPVKRQSESHSASTASELDGKSDGKLPTFALPCELIAFGSMPTEETTRTSAYTSNCCGTGADKPPMMTGTGLAEKEALSEKYVPPSTVDIRDYIRKCMAEFFPSVATQTDETYADDAAMTGSDKLIVPLKEVPINATEEHETATTMTDAVEKRTLSTLTDEMTTSNRGTETERAATKKEVTITAKKNAGPPPPTTTAESKRLGFSSDVNTEEERFIRRSLVSIDEDGGKTTNADLIRTKSGNFVSLYLDQHLDKRGPNRGDSNSDEEQEDDDTESSTYDQEPLSMAEEEEDEEEVELVDVDEMLALGLKKEPKKPDMEVDSSENWQPQDSRDRIIEKLKYVPAVSITDSMETQVQKVVQLVEKFRQMDGLQEHALKDVLAEADANDKLVTPAPSTVTTFEEDDDEDKFEKIVPKVRQREMFETLYDTRRVLCFETKTKKQPITKFKVRPVKRVEESTSDIFLHRLSADLVS